MTEVISNLRGVGSVRTPAASAAIDGRDLEAVNEGETPVVGPGLQALVADRLELLVVVGASPMTNVDDGHALIVVTEHARDVPLRGVNRGLAVR